MRKLDESLNGDKITDWKILKRHGIKVKKGGWIPEKHQKEKVRRLRERCSLNHEENHVKQGTCYQIELSFGCNNTGNPNPGGKKVIACQETSHLSL